jgi:hypothetical protein
MNTEPYDCLELWITEDQRWEAQRALHRGDCFEKLEGDLLAMEALDIYYRHGYPAPMELKLRALEEIKE